MAQSRLESFVEACINVAIGLVISLIANQFILPHYGTHLTLANNIQISAAYTVISIVRSYVVRRWFNARIKLVARAMTTPRAADEER